ncbi:MAG: hypothetical protein RL154_1402, partial [Pseudomonadota bacterium]
LNQRDAFKNAIASLKDRGYKIAINNFSLGSPNFTYIIEAGIDFIKIDSMSIGNFASIEQACEIVTQVYRLINACGAAAVAEHVCNEKTQKIVSSVGVEYSQGCFVGKTETMLDGI